MVHIVYSWHGALLSSIMPLVTRREVRPQSQEHGYIIFIHIQANYGLEFEVWSWETISPWLGAHKGKGAMEIGEGESNPWPLRSRQSETRIRGNKEEICQDRDKEKEWASTRPAIKRSWEGENLCLRESLCARRKVVRRKLEPLKWVMSGQTDPGFYPCT